MWTFFASDIGKKMVLITISEKHPEVRCYNIHVTAADPGFLEGGGGGGGGGLITMFTSGGGYGRGRTPSRNS